MTNQNSTFISNLAARGRDLLTLVAVGGFLLGVILVLSDNLSVRTKLAEMTGIPELRKAQEVLLASVEAMMTKQEVFSTTMLTRSRQAEQQRLEMLGRIDALEQNKQDKTPAIRFSATGHSISDGAPGDTVSIEHTFSKLRNCGRPIVDNLFSDSDGTLFRFDEVSITDDSGRGVAVPADTTQQHVLRYTARIPADRGVKAGDAFGWTIIGNYENCQWLAPQETPRIPFDIFEGPKER